MILTRDCKTVNTVALFDNPVAKSATISVMNAAINGILRPLRSPQTAKARAPKPASRVAARMRLISASLSPSAALVNGIVADRLDWAYPCPMPTAHMMKTTFRSSIENRPMGNRASVILRNTPGSYGSEGRGSATLSSVCGNMKDSGSVGDS